MKPAVRYLRPWTAAGLGVGLFALTSAAAQPSPAPSPAPAAPAASTPGHTGPRVVGVEPAQGGLGDHITLTVEGLAEVMRQAGGCSGVVLFIGDRALPDRPPEHCDPDNNHVGYLLDRNEKVRDEPSDRTWHVLLGRPSGFSRPVRLSVGSSAHRSYPTEVQQFQLVLLPKQGFWVFVVLSLSVLTLFYQLARHSDLLRDPNATPGPGQQRPYSLSRCQMGFWFVLVVLAYFFMWMVTGELDTITESVLALVGISSATALSARVIDSSKLENAASEASRQAGEKASLEAAISTLEKQLDTAAPGSGDALRIAADLATRKGRLAQLEGQLESPSAPGKSASSGHMLTDILSDSAGISIQRFQMFVWTIVLGLIFCGEVYRSLEMPAFSATLLGLMGISSGTYVGFKVPERFSAPKAETDPT
jgi:hypothetical protein